MHALSTGMPGLGVILPFGIIGIISWSFWLVRKILSATSRPVENDYRTTCHDRRAVVPRGTLRSWSAASGTWIAEHPQRVIIVLDVADTEARAHRRLGHPNVESPPVQAPGASGRRWLRHGWSTPSCTPHRLRHRGSRGCTPTSRCPSSTLPSAR